MTRVWLTGWEWSCCGDPFAVGDEIDFGIATRLLDPSLADALGPTLAATVDAVESHHEEVPVERVRGRAVAVYAVTQAVIERRILRRPGNGAPPDAVMPPDGEEWPLAGRGVGNGVFVGSQPSRYMIGAVSVPGTAVLLPVIGVRQPEVDPDDQHLSAPVEGDLAGDPPPERHTRSQVGWVVDIDDTDRRSDTAR
ncbi:DUF6578 domain-containing protein [uncultured Microbacterium sp.]|uniref:DUF6578 domain-containing protein n=1 Tax=uncultured Microbacterium sp. TaxID=191216 RepID=UPI0035CAE3DF